MTEEPVQKKIKTSPYRQPFGRNMTDVLFPSQTLDTRSPDYPLASVDWFLPNNFPTSGARGSNTDNNTKSLFPHTPPPSSTSPQSRDESFPNQQSLPQTAFKGLEDHMSQGNNPFENLSSSSIPQPVLSSNVRASVPSSQPPQQQQQTSQPQSLQQSPTPRSFAPIAPDPIGLQRMQAIRQTQQQHQDVEDAQQPKRRRLTQSSMDAPQQPPPLKDEDKLLLQLKDEQQLPWKNIVSRFQQETGKAHAIAALQMRYKRLKDRLQVWTDPDIEALKQAHEYWESRKFDIISAKMLEFGATEKFSALACRRKWAEMHPTSEYPLHTVPLMPGGGPPGAAGTPFPPSSSSPQPATHPPAAYPSMQSSSYHHLPQPQSGVYGSLPSQPSYPPHSQGYQSYGSYAPVTQPSQGTGYRTSPGQGPHAPGGYATPSPQQRFASYPPGGAPHGGQGGQGGGYWH